MIYLVPIEPLTERYTEQWYRKIPSAFNLPTTVIDGQELLKEDINVGTFLDINSTTHYKASQLQQIAKLFHTGRVKEGDTFFFYDMEFWGIESVRLLADMNNIKITLAGFLHAASFTKEDAFSIAAPYQQYTEVGWIAAMDYVFVGSEYQKQAVIERRLKPLNALHLREKIIPTGNPFFESEYETYKTNKRNLALLTNRLDREKRPLETLKLFSRVRKLLPDWEFLVCTGRKRLRGDEEAIAYLQKENIPVRYGLSKAEYHKYLSEAKIVVSHSIEESYGYCIAEALHYGATPLLYNTACHPEWVPYGAVLFDNEDDAVQEFLNISQSIVTTKSPEDGTKKIVDILEG